jgi:hypothetical protein
MKALVRGSMLAVTAVVVVTFDAAADEWTDKLQCWQWEQDPDRSIAACTKLIEQGGLAGGELSDAYRSRGRAHGEKHEHANAVADFNRAGELDPRNAPPYPGLLGIRPW